MRALRRVSRDALKAPSSGRPRHLSTQSSFQRKLSRILVATAIALPATVAPGISSAEGLLNFFFGNSQKQKPQGSFFDKVFDANLQPPQTEEPVDPSPGPGISSEAGFCVRNCDGKYFPPRRGVSSPSQLCEAFCPASATEVFFGSSIDTAYSESGKRYTASENAFAYRKALRADCTCNGRNPAGLAAIDLALDDTLRPGDVVATSNGFVAYSGAGVNDPIPEFTPVASFPGLPPKLRARLIDVKVAPAQTDTGTPLVIRMPPAANIGSKSSQARGKRSADALPATPPPGQ
jgi:uncharacterized protein DUF2865